MRFRVRLSSWGRLFAYWEYFDAKSEAEAVEYVKAYEPYGIVFGGAYKPLKLQKYENGQWRTIPCEMVPKETSM